MTTSTGTEVAITPGSSIESLLGAPPPDAANGYFSALLGIEPVGSGFINVDLVPDVVLAAEHFLLDGSGNLLEIRFPDPTGTSAGASIKFSGGTAQDTFKSPDETVFLGRWEGGSLDFFSDSGSTGSLSLDESFALGPRSAHWLLVAAPPPEYTLKLTGTTGYSLIASTKPTDALGNVGTLNSASLTADFSAQTVVAGLDLSFASTGTSIVMSTPSVPIDPNGGFESTTTSPYPPSINGCAGTSCPGYQGGIVGGFGRSNASAAALGYAFMPNPGANPDGASSNVIEGVAAFEAGTAPTVGTNPTPVSSGQYATQAFYTVDGSGGAQFLAANRTTPTTGRLPATSFVFQGNGLVRVVGGAWNVFDRGNETQCLLGTPCLFPATLPGDSSSIFSVSSTVGTGGFTFTNGLRSGSGATESYNDGIGIRFGRYQGGTVNASSDDSGFFNSAVTPLGGNSLFWVTREIPSSLPLTGTWHYTPAFGTAPADGIGNVGTLNWARLEADFSIQTVNPGVSATINNQTLTAWAQQVPINISRFSFDVSTSATQNSTFTPVPPSPLAVTCAGTNCAPPPVGVSGGGYGGRISGGFAGSGTADSAFMRYTFNTRYDPAATPGSGLTGAAPSGRVANDYINGMVGFTKGPEIQQHPLTALGNHVLASYYYYTGPSLFFGSNDSRVSADFFPFESTATFAGPNGNLSSVTEQTGLIPGARSLVIGGDTSAASTVSTSSNGISFGRYSGVTQNAVGPALTVSGVDHQGSFTGRNIVGDLHWITGPGIWPLFGSEVLTGTASYSVAAASSPTDQNNVTGTLNSATFNVNFDRQAVDTSLDVTLPGSRHWVASASNIALKDGGGFHADTNNNFTAPLAHRSLTVSLNGDSTNNASGNVSGQLTGPLMNGAVLSYTLGWGPFGSHEHVNGVVGFGSPSFSATADMLTPYRLKLDSLGSQLGFDSSTGSPRSGLLSAAAADHDYLTRTMVSAHDPNRLEFNSQGALTAFDTRAPIVSGGTTSCDPSICNVVDIASRVSINPAGSSASPPLPAMPTIASGPATVAEFGFDAATGISWGRYSSGNFAVADRVTGSPIGSGNFNPGPINHYLLTPVQSGPTTLPTTGTAVYTFAGGTSPTDSFGNIGTLNSATLNANFSAKTVDTGVNLSVGGRTWSASATALPILGGIGFMAEKIPGSTTGTLAVTCTGCASSQLAGQIVGGFGGSTGQGAGIAYTLNSGGLPQTHGGAAGAVTVGGVAAFRR